MADIKYTPSELLAQSAEMSALQSEYDALFVKTTSALNGLNESWSENLSRNFSGKIQSAQKSFSSIINMLSNGSIAAKLGATSHSPTSIESFFSSLGGADKLGTGGLDQIFSNLTDEDKKRLYDALPKEVKAMIKTSQDVDKYLAEKYGSLPEPMRKSIEAIIPSKIKDPISISHEVIAGEADFSTVGKATTLVTGNSELGGTVTAALEATINSKMDAIEKEAQHSLTKAANSLRSGDVSGGIMYNMEYVGYECQRLVRGIADGFTNYFGSALEASGDATRNPALSMVGSALHDLL